MFFFGTKLLSSQLCLVPTCWLCFPSAQTAVWRHTGGSRGRPAVSLIARLTRSRRALASGKRGSSPQHRSIHGEEGEIESPFGKPLTIRREVPRILIKTFWNSAKENPHLRACPSNRVVRLFGSWRRIFSFILSQQRQKRALWGRELVVAGGVWLLFPSNMAFLFIWCINLKGRHSVISPHFHHPSYCLFLTFQAPSSMKKLLRYPKIFPQISRTHKNRPSVCHVKSRPIRLPAISNSSRLLIGLWGDAWCAPNVTAPASFSTKGRWLVRSTD